MNRLQSTFGRRRALPVRWQASHWTVLVRLSQPAEDRWRGPARWALPLGRPSVQLTLWRRSGLTLAIRTTLTFNPMPARLVWTDWAARGKTLRPGPLLEE